MTQKIIVFIILAAVIGYIFFAYFRKSKSKKPNPCGGCTGCDLKEQLICNDAPKNLL